MMNIGDLIKSVMTVEATETKRPAQDFVYSNFRMSPSVPSDMDDEFYLYANMIDVTTIKTGIALINLNDDGYMMDDLVEALLDHKSRNNIEISDDMDEIKKEVLYTKFAFEVSYKYEGIGYVVCE